MTLPPRKPRSDKPSGPKAPYKPRGPFKPSGAKGPYKPGGPNAPKRSYDSKGPYKPRGAKGPYKPKGSYDSKGPRGPYKPKGPYRPRGPMGSKGPDGPRKTFAPRSAPVSSVPLAQVETKKTAAPAAFVSTFAGAGIVLHPPLRRQDAKKTLDQDEQIKTVQNSKETFRAAGRPLFRGPRKPGGPDSFRSRPGGSSGPRPSGPRPAGPGGTSDTISPSRLESAKALLKIEKGAKVADVMEVRGLIAEDMALFRELVYGCTRQKRLLDYHLDKLCQSPFAKLPVEVKISMRLGLYQLLFLTRVPAHAAVHEAVNLVKGAGQDALSGFTNAVLRNAEKQKAEFKIEGEDELDTLAIKYSHPTWLVKRWATGLSTDGLNTENLEPVLAANNKPHPVFLRSKPGMGEKVREDLLAQNVRVEPLAWPPYTLRLASHEGGLFSGESFGQGDWFVQDWTPQAMLEMLPFNNVFRAWDVCAAPGGKTAGLAWKLDEKGEVWATDFSPVRMVKLKENLRRLGLNKVRVFEETIDKIPPAQKFDLIWVDAPCSGTGVLSRRADLRWKLKREEIKKHAVEQLKLLEEVNGHLYPKGYLVYSTCSLEREENQDLINTFMESHPGWDLAIPTAPPEVTHLLKDHWGITFLPTQDRDGGFLSVIQKNRN